MARIFLTGGNGEIGTAILLALARKHDVVALTRSSPRDAHPRVNWVYGTLTDVSTFSNRLEGCDALVHLAAETRSRELEKLFRMNVDASAHLVDAAHEAGIKKIIVFSSASVTQRVQTPYAQSKSEMEKRLLGKRFPLIILRPTFVYFQNSRYLKKIAAWATLPLPFIPYPNAGRARIDPIHRDDVIQVVNALLSEKNPTEKAVYDLASREKYTVLDALASIQKKLGTHKPILGVSNALLFSLSTAVAPLHRAFSAQLNAFGVLGESYRVDPEKITRKYGLKFLDPHVELEKCLDFLKKEN